MGPFWDDYRAVLAVVRGKTLSAAASALGVNYTTVARRISRAEATLDTALFERLADGYRPTEAGKLIATRAAEMEAAEHSMLRALAGRDQRLGGSLTITAPQLLIVHVLAPVLQAFRDRHPDVELRMRASNEILDLNRREADLAIRVSRTPGDNLTGLRLATQHNASFASQLWAERFAADPQTPQDWLVYEQFPTLPDQVTDRYPNARVVMVFDDMVSMAGAAEQGLGIVRMPMFLGRALPGLVQVPILPPQPYADIWVVGHPDVWPGAKLSAFRDVLVPYFRAHRSDFVDV